MSGVVHLRARWIAPVDRAPMRDGYVSVVDGRISAVAAGWPADGDVEDLGDVVLLPGLVNAHTHLEFSDLVAPLGSPGMSLPEWIRHVIAQRRRSGRDVAAAVTAGVAENVAAGTTAIGDITANAGVNAPGPTIVSFQESIGFSAARVESALADVQRRFLASGPVAALSPHAPYTVHPRLLSRLVSLASRHGAAVAMHLAESREELELLSSGQGAFRELLEERSMWDPDAIERGARPLKYLQALAKATRALVVHGNYLATDEIEFIGQRRTSMSVVYCPRTHEYFGHDFYPLGAMLAAGVRVALGTDSRASNPDLSMLAELRHAVRKHPEVEPAAWLRMATLHGAEALGLSKSLGSLAVGKRADLVALPCDAIDPLVALLDEAVPIAVWVGGVRKSLR